MICLLIIYIHDLGVENVQNREFQSVVCLTGHEVWQMLHDLPHTDPTLYAEIL